MNDQFYELLSALAVTFAPTGCEVRLAEKIEKELKDIGGKCYYDKKGNLIFHLPGKGKRTMVVSPMDEASFMITDIDGDGYIRVASTGNADPGCFLGKKIAVGNEEVVYQGVGGGKVLHLTSGGERTDNPSFEKLFVDIGTPRKTGQNKENKEENREDKPEDKKSDLKLKKGDFAAYAGGTFHLPGGYFAGKALESRTCVAVALESAKKEALKPEEERKDLYYIFTVKEKAGYSGAVTAAYAIAPKHAILLGYAPSNAFDDVEDHLKGATPGKGVGIAMKDGRVLFYDAPLYKKTVEIARREGILYEEINGDLSDSAGEVHLSREGVETVSLRIPCFNPETPAVILKKQDIDAMYELLGALLAEND